MMDLQIAWRNLWRSPRRTVVILIAITLGVWTMLFSAAFMRGFMVAMMEKSVANLTGHLQVHRAGFLTDPGVSHSIDQPEEVGAVLASELPGSASWCRRVRVSAVVNNARHSAGFELVGVEWQRETACSFLGQAPIEGEVLEEADERGIVIGRAFMEKMETRIGHKLILSTQGVDGEIVSRAFRIKGVYDTELEATEKAFGFVSVRAAQTFLGLGNQVSEYAVLLEDEEDAGAVTQQIRDRLDLDRYEVSDWMELLPVVRAYIEIWDQFYYIWNLVFFIAMSFGIVNTLLMAVYERIREFGLLRSLGMRSVRIVRLVVAESTFMLLLGIAAGNLSTWLSILWFRKDGIDLSAFANSSEYFEMSRVVYPSLTASDIHGVNVMVLVLGVLVCLYPALKAARFTPVEAMQHVG